MSKRQSKACHFGAQCQNARCAFKHPDRCIFSYAPEPEATRLDEQKQKDIEETEFAESMLHAIHINELSDSIVYTREDLDEPYMIERFPELGLFSTWDNAYDTLLEFMYKGMTAPLEPQINAC
jgi:hypothetical protein